MVLTFVTSNENKLKEVQVILSGLEVVNNKVDLAEIQGSYEEIAAHKARSAAEVVGGPVIVDDTALEYDAYGKELPGPYIKWFLNSMGADNLVKMLDGFDNKGANAVCTVGYCSGPGQEVKTFIAKTHGKIVPSRGSHNFGWDCIFEPDNMDKTYAEMDKCDKNEISHRGKAFRQLKDYLKSI